MFCEKVIKDVAVYDHNNPNEPFQPGEAYFVLEGPAQEAVEFFGELKGRAITMQNLLEWLRPEFSNAYVLLVSLDGKRGIVYPRVSVEEAEKEGMVVRLGTEDHYYPNEIRRMVNHFKGHMLQNPELAAIIGYQAPARAIKSRINFDLIRQDFAPGDMNTEILAAIQNIESATDDALVWLAIAGRPNGRGMYSFDYDSVLRELTMRTNKGMEFRSTFFPLSEVTMAEIQARATRAVRTLATFKRKFEGNYERDVDAIDAWVRRLDSDRLAELAVITYYSDAGLDGSWKYVVGWFQSRFPR